MVRVQTANVQARGGQDIMAASYIVIAALVVAYPQSRGSAAVADEIPITARTADAIEHFKKGRSLHENMRDSEAVEELKLALKSDPGCVLAQAYLGMAESGPQGRTRLEEANSRAGQLPVAERLLIEANLVLMRGEVAKATTLFTQLTGHVPRDWRAHLLLAEVLMQTSQEAQAIRELRLAT